MIGIFGDPGHDRALAVGLSRVLFPIVALLGVSGIIVGILNSYDHFTVPAISPVFWNIAIIIGLAIGVPHAHGDEREALRVRGLDPRSRRSSRCSYPCRGCAVATTGCGSCSTGATPLSSASSC